ncbi:MAG TPA: sugar isomerase domain-containing protein [Candidatus Limnocylindrales bacterium]|nr:sugar isomerase domain-containing protein [Candidatus Limnocylindrales bacterium]
MTAALYDTYLERVNALVARIAAEEREPILRAAVAVADRVAEDRLVNVIGPGGHSSMGAEEVFFRAGGLACVNAILDEGYLLAHGALRSMAVERTPGYARTILANAGLAPGDVLVIVNAYGVNSGTIDSATYAREIGATTIGVTSVELQRALPKDHPARHPSRQDLCDVVDITIDTKVPLGDALIEVDGVRERVGAVSTFANAFAMNALMLEAVAELARRGVEAPIWRSGNSPGGDEANRAVIERYRGRVKRL